MTYITEEEIFTLNLDSLISKTPQKYIQIRQNIKSIICTLVLHFNLA